MSSAVIQLLVLAGVAIFLILRLRSVLGTREGFEKPPVPLQRSGAPQDNARAEFEVIEGGLDRDITDHAAEGSDTAIALAAMKSREPDFGVSDFLSGAKGAYEMILMAFENGDLTDVMPFLDEDVYETLQSVIDSRQEQGVTVDANFVGVRDTGLTSASFDGGTGMAEITVRFVAELTSVVRASDGAVIEGNPNEIKRQRDVWTFARSMGGGDPNWNLIATGE